MVELSHSTDSTNTGAGSTKPDSADDGLLSEAWGWTKGNVVNPFVNAAAIEPYNAVASTANLLTGHSSNPFIPEATTLKTDDAKFLRPGWFAQEISGGLGMILPYVVAGKATGGAMRYGGARMGLEGGWAAFAQDERVAQIAGAGIYGVMQDPKQGQSRLGNFASSIAAFGVFEAGNTFTNKLAMRSLQDEAASTLMARTVQIGQQVGLRAATGGIAGLAQISISKGIAQHKAPTSDEFIQAAVSGGVMNIALPPIQTLGGKAIDGVRQQLGLGTPVDRYFANNPEARAAMVQSDSLKQAVGDNPWSKIQEKTGQDASNQSTRRVLLSDRFDPEKVGHQLTHLSSDYEGGFKQAADVLASGDRVAAQQAYLDVRTNQELDARAVQAKIREELGKPADPVIPKENIGDQIAFAGKTYKQVWLREFGEFEQTKGQYRPSEDMDGLDKSLTPQEAARESEFQKGIATKICKTLQDAGFIGVFAGGAVRDELMGRTPKDFDLATSATPEQVEKIFKDAGITVFPKGQAFGVECVVLYGRQFEIATLRTDSKSSDGRRPDSVKYVTSLKDDAARRDLTVNAMFKDPVTGKIFDFFNGRQDLKNKILRAVGDPNARFEEDKLRMMRVPRFYSRLSDFTVDPALEDAVRAHAHEITTVSGERMRDEMSGILTSSEPVRGLQFMMDTGLMKHVLPEVAEMDGPKGMQDANHHPEGTAWAHTKMVVNGLKGSSFEVMLGGLLHDIGKPLTQEIHADGGISNHKHEDVGADMASDIAHRFVLTNKQTDRLFQMVKVHMQMHRVQELRPGKLRNILSRPDINDLIDLQHADATGRGNGMADGSQKQFLLGKLDEYQNAPDTQKLNAKPLVNGDVLREMDFKPGPIFSRVIDSAKQAQLDGKFGTVDAGRQYVLDNFAQWRGVPFSNQLDLLEAADNSGH